MESSEKIIEWLNGMMESGKIEIYLFYILLLFTLWYIYSTIRYYYAQKRKLRWMHRFAKEGDVEAQYHLAKRYRKGDIVPKSPQRAIFWYQKAAFSGNSEARKVFNEVMKKYRK